MWLVTLAYTSGMDRKIQETKFDTEQKARAFITNQLDEYKLKMQKWEKNARVELKQTSNSWTIGLHPAHDTYWGDTYTLEQI